MTNLKKDAEAPVGEQIAPLAYENPQFLNSPDGRLLRIMSEYVEPLARFRREQIQDTVVFFDPIAAMVWFACSRPWRRSGRMTPKVSASWRKQEWTWRAITKTRGAWHSC